MRREIPSIAAMAILLISSQLVAIALSPLFYEAKFQAFPSPQDVTNTVVCLIMILVFTAIILGLVRYRRQSLAKYVILASTLVTLASVLLLPVLIAVATYDAWAVYRTKHMITLADELTSQRLPILLVIPKRAGYSFRDQKSLKTQLDSGEEREAMFVGLGDLIIPGILAVSSFTFLNQNELNAVGLSLGPLAPYAIVALMTVIGSLIGFVVLMRYVLKGNPQAGLPLLNGGALLGFVLSSLLVYGTVHIV